jgi:YVTN family beta-propeller protein
MGTIRAALILVAIGCGKTQEPPPPGCDPNAIDWTVWVTNQAAGQDTVTVFRNHGDEKINAEILAKIPVGRAPHNIQFSPDRTRAYVVNLGTPPANGSISVIDAATYKVLATVEAGIKSHGVTVTPDGKWVWVANVTSNDITVINAETLKAEPERIAVGTGPALVAFLPDGRKAYVSNGKSGTTSVVDVGTRKVLKTLTTGAGAMGLAVSTDGRRVFETEGDDGRVSVIDTSTDEIVKVITFNETLKEPHDVALAGWDLLITNRTGNSLSFVDTRTLEKSASVAVPGRPDIIGVAPNCDRAYMTLRDVAGVAVVDLRDRKYLDLVGLGTGDVHGIAVLRGGK